jgi:hypothetical protein
LLGSAAYGAFTTKTVIEAKAILQNMLQNHSEWNTKKAPTTSTKKVNFVKELENSSATIDAMMAMCKPNLGKLSLQKPVANNVEGIDVNYI